MPDLYLDITSIEILGLVMSVLVKAGHNGHARTAEICGSCTCLNFGKSPGKVNGGELWLYATKSRRKALSVACNTVWL
eukprot:jgi/Botrbrau1/9301/Bobra.0111s0025.1